MTQPFEDRTRGHSTTQSHPPDPATADAAGARADPLWRCSGCRVQYAVTTTMSCPVCVVCDRCERTEPRTETILTLDGDFICSACQDHYWRCESCDGWNREGHDCDNGCCDSPGCTCGSCDDDPEDRPLIYSYGYKPAPVFHGAGPLFLGPEIEIQTPYDSRRACALLAVEHLGELGYLKEDSSIDHGFEIVTHPMAYDWAMTHFPWQLLTDLHQEGCRATDGTGIHVHLSRTGFSSDCHAYRWMKFIYRNEAQVTAVARRSSYEFAAFTDDDRRAVKHYAKGGRSHRYRAINTNNADTFELRIFASSLDPAEVQAALGFAAASVEYTRDLSVPAIARRGGWTWSAFVTWLSSRPAYMPLLRQLEELACVC